MSGRLPKSKKVRLGYFCSYVPFEMLKNAGIEMVSLSEISQNSCRTSELSVNLCTYVRFIESIVDSAHIDGVILTNCCNSSQRLYDYIKTRRPNFFCYILELPKKSSELDAQFFRHSVRLLVQRISEVYGIMLSSSTDSSKDESDLTNSIREQTVYLMGSAISNETVSIIRDSVFPLSLAVNSCSNKNNGDRMLQPQKFEGLRSALSGLGQPCPRMDCFAEYFKAFFSKNRENLKGIIFLCAKNCDLYLLAYPVINSLCEENEIPILYLEQEYVEQSTGQILTRIEAFVESLDSAKPVNIAKTSDSSRLSHFGSTMRLVSGVTDRLPMSAIRVIVSYQIKMFSEEIFKHPEKVVFTNMAMTSEILYAAGLIPVNMELISGWLSSLRLASRCIRESESSGISSSLCSYHKAVIGLIAQGGLPVPAAIVMTTNICDGGPGFASYCANSYGTKTFILNVPFSGVTEDNVSYLSAQYSQLKSWLEDFTGEELSQDKLQKSLELSNQARAYWLLAQKLRTGKPLIPGYLSLRNLFGATFLFGSEIGVQVSREYYNELFQLSKAHVSSLPSAKKRILWVHFAPLYGKSIMEFIEQTLGCCIVMDITAYICWDQHDLSNPIESLSKRALSHFYLGEPEKRKELYKNLIKEYSIDAVIHFMQKGCRAIPGSSFIVREAAKETGTSYLELTGDCIDSSDYSEEQLRLRVAALCESMGCD
jgi:benzoyl-CoA reductase/2-hydroxyglutaryl-CoA dehydratase subunit BcrC/BadD/HgdB